MMIARSRLFALSLGIFSIAPLSSSFLPPQYLPIYGGSGGTAFTRTCGAGYVMTGVRFRVGIVVDAVGVLCRQVKSNGTLGSETTVGSLVGGGGGQAGTRSCLAGQVVIGQLINYATYVDGFQLRCEKWNAGTRTFGPVSSEIFTAPVGGAGGVGSTTNLKQCEAAGQPAIGIRGRAHSLLDAFGLICNEP